jgi:hypothetical protein
VPTRVCTHHCGYGDEWGAVRASIHLIAHC